MAEARRDRQQHRAAAGRREPRSARGGVRHALASLTAALLRGLLPAFTTTRLALGAALRDGVRGSTSAAGARLRPLLVGPEVALADRAAVWRAACSCAA